MNTYHTKIPRFIWNIFKNMGRMIHSVCNCSTCLSTCYFVWVFSVYYRFIAWKKKSRGIWCITLQVPSIILKKKQKLFRSIRATQPKIVRWHCTLGRRWTFGFDNLHCTIFDCCTMNRLCGLQSGSPHSVLLICNVVYLLTYQYINMFPAGTNRWRLLIYVHFS